MEHVGAPGNRQHAATVSYEERLQRGYARYEQRTDASVPGPVHEARKWYA